jgi:hypothetical protein
MWSPPNLYITGEEDSLISNKIQPKPNKDEKT